MGARGGAAGVFQARKSPSFSLLFRVDPPADNPPPPTTEDAARPAAAPAADDGRPGPRAAALGAGPHGRVRLLGHVLRRGAVAGAALRLPLLCPGLLLRRLLPPGAAR